MQSRDFRDCPEPDRLFGRGERAPEILSQRILQANQLQTLGIIVEQQHPASAREREGLVLPLSQFPCVEGDHVPVRAQGFEQALA